MAQTSKPVSLIELDELDEPVEHVEAAAATMDDVDDQAVALDAEHKDDPMDLDPAPPKSSVAPSAAAASASAPAGSKKRTSYDDNKDDEDDEDVSEQGADGEHEGEAMSLRKKRKTASGARAGTGASAAAAASTSAPAVSKKQKRVTATAVKGEITKHQKANDWGRANGHSMSGMWTKEVIVRGKRSFSGDRVRQVLRHISTVIYHYVKPKIKDEQEVQAMLVNDRILISSNDKQSMELFSGSQDPQVLFDILLRGASLPESDSRAQGVVKKLRALVVGTRLEKITTDEAEQRELKSIKAVILGAIKDPSTHVQHCNLSATPDMINNSNGAGQLIFVEGLDKAHAEQNLIIAYALSGSTTPVKIYGKKRPCTGCYLTFCYATEFLKLPITYNIKPGGF